MDSLAHGTARLLTSTGRSAIAVIRMVGNLSQLDWPTSLFRAANHKQVGEQSINAICFGVWGHPGEEVVVCRTEDNAVEVTCHGGAAAVARILEDAADRGFQVEAAPNVDWRPLTQARTQRTAEILLEQVTVWPQFIEGLSQHPPDEALGLIDGALAWSEFGRHLTEPWSVVLCGRPNVGKSSLMNALAGFTRSIVSEQAGTTRDRVTLETAIDGWPVRITDTAGVRESSDTIEQAGVEQTLSAIDQADLVVLVLDSTASLQTEDRQLLAVPAQWRLPVAHKSDRPRSTDADFPADCLAVSSVSGQGIEALLQTIAATLIPACPPPGQPIPVTPEQESELRRWREPAEPRLASDRFPQIHLPFVPAGTPDTSPPFQRWESDPDKSPSPARDGR